MNERYQPTHRFGCTCQPCAWTRYTQLQCEQEVDAGLQAESRAIRIVGLIALGLLLLTSIFAWS